MAEVIVSHHATKALRERRRAIKDDGRPFRDVEQEIHDCVSQALEEGRVFDHKPDGFVLYRRRSNRLPDGQRFVQCHHDYGFVVKTDEREDIIVLTMLSRVGVRK